MRELPGASLQRRARLSRRQFLEGIMAIAATGAAASVHSGVSRVAVTAANVRPRIARAPVVSFHLDRPYLDPTGLAEPYVAPAGVRAGQPLAELPDEELLGSYRM